MFTFEMHLLVKKHTRKNGTRGDDLNMEAYIFSNEKTQPSH